MRRLSTITLASLLALVLVACSTTTPEKPLTDDEYVAAVSEFVTQSEVQNFAMEHDAANGTYTISWDESDNANTYWLLLSVNGGTYEPIQRITVSNDASAMQAGDSWKIPPNMTVTCDPRSWWCELPDGTRLPESSLFQIELIEAILRTDLETRSENDGWDVIMSVISLRTPTTTPEDAKEAIEALKEAMESGDSGDLRRNLEPRTSDAGNLPTPGDLNIDRGVLDQMLQLRNQELAEWRQKHQEKDKSTLELLREIQEDDRSPLREIVPSPRLVAPELLDTEGENLSKFVFVQSNPPGSISFSAVAPVTQDTVVRTPSLVGSSPGLKVAIRKQSNHRFEIVASRDGAGYAVFADNYGDAEVVFCFYSGSAPAVTDGHAKACQFNTEDRQLEIIENNDSDDNYIEATHYAALNIDSPKNVRVQVSSLLPSQGDMKFKLVSNDKDFTSGETFENPAQIEREINPGELIHSIKIQPGESLPANKKLLILVEIIDTDSDEILFWDIYEIDVDAPSAESSNL